MTFSPEEQAKAATRIGDLERLIAQQQESITEARGAADLASRQDVLRQFYEQSNTLRAQIGLPLVVPSAMTPSPSAGLGFGRGLAIVSILLVTLGCFVPIMTFAFDNSSVTLFKGGTGDGVVFIVLMAAAVLLTVARQGIGVVIVGLISLLLSLWSLQSSAAVMRGLASDPACLPSVCATSWGSGYLLVLSGSLMLMVAGGSMGKSTKA